MDLVQHLRTFLTVARLGSLSASAREMGTVPSVVSKRIAQVEHMAKATLFTRTTRGLELTPEGLICQRRFANLLSEIDTAFQSVAAPDAIYDHLRVRCPTTLAATYVGKLIHDFRKTHPGVRIDLDLVDRSVNPLEEGFDIAIGGMPSSYPQVRDIPLFPLPRTLVAAPDYFETRPMPRHPRELAHLDCLVFPTSGSLWTFDGPSTEVAVEVNTVFTVPDTRILIDGVLAGTGIAVVSDYSLGDLLETGRLLKLLPDWKVHELHLKILVPERQNDNPAVAALVDTLVAGMRAAFPGTA